MIHEHDLTPEPAPTDPVCGMPVAPDAAITAEYRGVTYRFCDPACAATFRDEPGRWVNEAGTEGFVHSHHH
jgi:P-type Cu+ transporter